MTFREATPSPSVSPAPNGLVRHEFATTFGRVHITAPSWFAARQQLTGEDREQAVCVGREDVVSEAENDATKTGKVWGGLEGEWSDDWEAEVEGG